MIKIAGSLSLLTTLLFCGVMVTLSRPSGFCAGRQPGSLPASGGTRKPLSSQGQEEQPEASLARELGWREHP